MHLLLARLAAATLLTAFICEGKAAPAPSSQCFGRVGLGRVSGAVQLPASGTNFLAYHSMGVRSGRTYVHASVRDIVVDAYAAVATAMPATMYEYGETGWQSGGRFRPHRTHQAGISVDFMVPVRDAAGVSLALPATVFNQFGYGWEFDDSGRAGGLRIDFDAMAAHLMALKQAADAHHIAIDKVIFDPRLSLLLFKSSRGAELAATLPFMKQAPWIRHDEHYHVDFKLPCRPLAQFKQ